MLQIPSKMKRSNAKMLQIPLKRQLLAPKCYKFHQNAANSMENERFQLQNVAKTVEMAASSSKMLQIARKTGRKNRSKKTSQNGKNIIPKTILDPIINKQHLWIQWQVLAWSQPSLPLACGCLVLPKPSSKFQDQRRSKLLPVGKLRTGKLAGVMGIILKGLPGTSRSYQIC